MPKNLSKIVKENKIELIISIGELFKIFRSKNPNSKFDFSSGEKTLEKICSFNLPVIIFKGNMFDHEEGRPYWRNFLKVYKKKYPKLIYKKTGKFKIKGKTLILFDMIYEGHSHRRGKNKSVQLENKKRLKHLLKLLKENPGAPLLSHAPPYKILDKTASGKYVGSKILLEAIKKAKPKLVLCGHIHEAKGKRRRLQNI